MKNNSTNNSPYAEARAKWAKAQTELFLNTMEQMGNRLGIKITPMQYVQAYKLCIEDLKFGYPAEYRIAELFSPDETYDQVLAIMSEVMKRFRLAFRMQCKRQTEQKKKKPRKKAA